MYNLHRSVTSHITSLSLPPSLLSLYSFVYSLIHLFIHSFIRPLVCLFVRSFYCNRTLTIQSVINCIFILVVCQSIFTHDLWQFRNWIEITITIEIEINVRYWTMAQYITKTYAHNSSYVTFNICHAVRGFMLLNTIRE